MIELQNVYKSYKDKKILENINLVIEDNSIVVLIGESGCGKTTTLKMINRLIEPTKGKIMINGKDIKKTNPIKLRRSIGYVIQQTGLFPHLTIRQNIELISKLEKKEKKMIQEKTMELMKMVGLSGFEKSLPKELSGGMAQRTNIARALVNNPYILFLDEPFGALDAFTKIQLQNELLNIKKKEKSTMIMVTHDIEEAVYLADRIIVMDRNPGRIKDIVTVNLPRPRNRNDYDFVRIRQKIYSYFFQGKVVQEEYNI